MMIYDCFTFFNELDTLEMRLNILNNQVDYFVLVEATKTHSGQGKELYYEKNKIRFSNFSNKIIHIVVDDMPKIENGDRWVLENFQRNAIMRGLLGCKNDDIVMISDLDEIPNLENLGDFKKILLTTGKNNDILYNIHIALKKFIFDLKTDSKIIKIVRKIFYYLPVKSNRIICLKQRLHYYYLNGFINNDWLGSKVVLYKDLIGQYRSSPQQVRNSLAETVIQNGGWHFSYLFNPEEISKKIKSFAHSEYDRPEYTDIKIIKERIEKGENLFGRIEEKITYIKVDNSYPKYILENLEKYDSYINHNYSNK